MEEDQQIKMSGDETKQKHLAWSAILVWTNFNYVL